MLRLHILFNLFSVADYPYGFPGCSRVPALWGAPRSGRPHAPGGPALYEILVFKGFRWLGRPRSMHISRLIPFESLYSWDLPTGAPHLQGPRTFRGPALAGDPHLQGPALTGPRTYRGPALTGTPHLQGSRSYTVYTGQGLVVPV